MIHIANGTIVTLKSGSDYDPGTQPAVAPPPLGPIRATATIRMTDETKAALEELMRLPPGTVVIHGFDFDEPSRLGLTEADVVSYMQSRGTVK